MVYTSESKLIEDANKLEGMRVSDIDRMVSRLDNIRRNYTKSVIANIIETGYFGIPTNSSEEADFKELGIELKVSPLKRVERVDLVNAKERNVIGMVDYQDVYDNPSWHDNKRLRGKLNKVLFVFYLHDNNVSASDWYVISTFLWEPRIIYDDNIQEDYNIIRNKIIAGERNSERHNTFLGTCPKHGGGYNKQYPDQSPRSALCDHPTIAYAEKRGFCIKNKPVTTLVAEALGTRPIKKGATLGIRPEDFNVPLEIFRT